MTLTKRALCASLLLIGSQAMARDSAAPAVSSPRVYVFDCGTVEVSDIAIFSPGVDKGKKKVLTDTCYLVAHPKGTLMWDTGLSDEIATMADGKKLSDAFHARLKKPLAAQLKEIGYGPDSVNFLGLSHMHFDHIGNVGMFPKATLLMQKEEYESAFGPDAAKFGNDAKNYPTLAANPSQQLSGDHDVFGDGTVVIKRAPGHTPGHQALFVKLKKTGNVVLSGDLAHFTKNWENRRVPSFNFDKDMSVKAMNDMAAFMKQNKARFWIQHDLEQNQKLRHAPRYYD